MARGTSSTDSSKSACLAAAFYLHIRVIWGIIEVTDIPEPPDTDTLETFNQRFNSMDQIIDARNKLADVPPPNNDMISRIQELRANFSSNSRNAKQASRLSDVILGYVFALIMHFRLRRFKPDFRQSPSSTYNLVHRLIAIDTWRQALAAGAYDGIPGIDKSFIDDFLLWTRAADHFINHYIRKIYEREQRYPGIMKEIATRDAERGRQRALAAARVKWLKAAQYPQRVIDLVGSIDGTSDDEASSIPVSGGANAPSVTVDVYRIRKKVGRADVVTKFIRHIDRARKQGQVQRSGSRLTPVQAAKQKAGKQERTRIEVDDPAFVSIERLPTKVPLDWYDPTAFNACDVSFRAKFLKTEPTIAMPDNLSLLTQTNPIPDWRRMTDKVWMRKHGKARLAKYDLPTAIEMKTDSEGDKDDSSDEEDTGTGGGGQGGSGGGQGGSGGGQGGSGGGRGGSGGGQGGSGGGSGDAGAAGSSNRSTHASSGGGSSSTSGAKDRPTAGRSGTTSRPGASAGAGSSSRQRGGNASSSRTASHGAHEDDDDDDDREADELDGELMQLDESEEPSRRDFAKVLGELFGPMSKRAAAAAQNTPSTSSAQQSSTSRIPVPGGTAPASRPAAQMGAGTVPQGGFRRAGHQIGPRGGAPFVPAGGSSSSSGTRKDRKGKAKADDDTMDTQ
ncbi:hypothetical protein EXIGLDRAFT_831179 [Exidia glandulosa HHB12029]|uniref:Uncharacterized protein n=1 Tax=Exidia glandulosa HHB12029 TaxID=1314781 RepID=A0A165MUP7_EXIGL|nr:hypothetical protein EXIGLDRAFT_831179 [Exidia glandulosa HHB12029]